MKKTLILSFCLLLILSLTSCDWFDRNQTETTLESTGPSSGQTTGSSVETTTTASTAGDTTTATVSEPTASETTTTAAAETTTTATTPSDTTETTTTESSSTTTTESTAAPTTTAAGPSLYSSYALMKTYDALTGEAQFDYFDMLRGADAVQWLVTYEGKTEAEAQAIVDDYADSEFIMKNLNPRLRTIDLTDLPLKLMYFPDGTVVDGATPDDADINDLNTLYAAHPDLVLNSFFYFVEVSDGEVVLVEQVYWP